MGADLMVTKFPRFTVTDNRKQSLKNTIDSLFESDIDEMREMYFFDDESEEEIKQALLEAVEFSAEAETRETTSFSEYNQEGERFYSNVTGGMSWGDSPTEAFDQFNLASYFEEICLMALDFAVEDCKIEA